MSEKFRTFAYVNKKQLKALNYGSKSFIKSFDNQVGIWFLCIGIADGCTDGLESVCKSCSHLGISLCGAFRHCLLWREERQGEKIRPLLIS